MQPLLPLYELDRQHDTGVGLDVLVRESPQIAVCPLVLLLKEL